jgi:isochorismate synthase
MPGTYHADFTAFHNRLIDGIFQKLVLSRSLDIRRQGDVDAFALFRKACELYPRVFISLVFTPQSGLWLTATPEVLLAGNGSEWQTMALAGTMPFAENIGWSDKNIQEQRYVATYITEKLEQFSCDISEQGPRTVRAGHLAHLRSDFHFTLKDVNRLGELIETLHPTPAVCGLPKEEAFRFILDTEHNDRCYYSGFMGPLHLLSETRLFVTLRCMQIFRDGYRLYAGGGLLKDSVEEQEWQETESKLDTMRRVLLL